MSDRPPISDFDAVGLIEGFVEGAPSGWEDAEDDDLMRACWQTIIDNGTVWGLQGRFGRQAMNLIVEGECRPPPGKKLDTSGHRPILVPDIPEPEPDTRPPPKTIWEALDRIVEDSGYPAEEWNWRVDWNSIPVDDDSEQGWRYQSFLCVYIMGSGASQCVGQVPTKFEDIDALCAAVSERYSVKCLKGVG